MRIFDCTVQRWIDDDGVFCTERGAGAYTAGHIPGAAHLDLVHDLSDPESALRFTLPTAQRFADAVSRMGVGDQSRVVLYGTQDVQYVTRVWWMFRVFGFDDAAVLNGGWQAWTRDGGPVSTDLPNHAPGEFTPRFRPELVVDKAQVLDALQNPATCVIKALAPDIHSGATHVHYGPRGQTSRRGRIPGTTNLWALDLIDAETNKFLPLDVLQAKFTGVGAQTAAGSSRIEARASPPQAMPLPWRCWGATTLRSMMPLCRNGPVILRCPWKMTSDDG